MKVTLKSNELMANVVLNSHNLEFIVFRIDKRDIGYEVV